MHSVRSVPYGASKMDAKAGRCSCRLKLLRLRLPATQVTERMPQISCSAQSFLPAYMLSDCAFSDIDIKCMLNLRHAYAKILSSQLDILNLRMSSQLVDVTCSRSLHLIQVAPMFISTGMVLSSWSSIEHW
jgi:hypothetical protein